MKKILLILLIFSFFLNAKDIDVNVLSNQAKKENKHLMFFYHMPGCPKCKKMLRENFKDEKIIKTINENFILVNIDITSNTKIKFKDFEGTEKSFAKYMKVYAVPATQFFDNNFNEIKIIEDDDTQTDKNRYQPILGLRDIRDYNKYFDFVILKNYITTSFEEFSSQWDFEHD